MLVRIDPPFKAFDGELIDVVMVAPRHKGRTLFPINDWYLLCVYIVILLADWRTANGTLRQDEYIIQSWGELYETKADAIEAIKYLDDIPQKRTSELPKTFSVAEQFCCPADFDSISVSEQERGAPCFYLASGEHAILREPRKCWIVKPIKTQYRDGGMLINVDPPFKGEWVDFNVQDIDTVMILPRHEGRTLFPINEWPLYVYIIRLLVDPSKLNDTLRQGEYTCDFWGELYETKEAATEAMMFWDDDPKEWPLTTQDAKDASIGDSETSQDSTENDNKNLGIKWMKFWTYVLLPAFTLLLACSLATVLIEAGAAFSAFAIPSVITALLMTVICGLHKRYLYAWRLNMVGIIAFFLLYFAVFANFDPEIGTQIAGFLIYVAWTISNIVYWCNRKRMFK